MWSYALSPAATDGTCEMSQRQRLCHKSLISCFSWLDIGPNTGPMLQYNTGSSTATPILHQHTETTEKTPSSQWLHPHRLYIA